MIGHSDLTISSFIHFWDWGKIFDSPVRPLSSALSNCDPQRLCRADRPSKLVILD
jgi:hypothetical protein